MKTYLGWKKSQWIHISVIFLVLLTHQILEKIFHLHHTWVDNYLDPLLCMPLFLSGLLLERRWLIYPKQEYHLPLLHIIAATILISLIAELLFPYLKPAFVGDIYDVVCYFIGSLYFYIFFNR